MSKKVKTSQIENKKVESIPGPICKVFSIVIVVGLLLMLLVPSLDPVIVQKSIEVGAYLTVFVFLVFPVLLVLLNVSEQGDSDNIDSWVKKLENKLTLVLEKAHHQKWSIGLVAVLASLCFALLGLLWAK